MFNIICHRELQIKAMRLEWLKCKTLITPNADEDGEQQELSFIAGGNANGAATLEDRLVVSSKTKFTFIV